MAPLKQFASTKWRVIRNYLKALKLKVYCLRFDKRPQTEIEMHAVRKIVLLRWDDKLGDAVMAGALVKALTQHPNNYKVTVITGKRTANWYRSIADVEVIETPKKRGKECAKWLGQFQGRFDLMVDLGTSFSFKELLATSNLCAARNLGYNKQKYAIFSDNVSPTHTHFLARYSEAYRLITQQKSEQMLPIPTPDFASAKQQFEHWLSELDGQDIGKVAVNLFGATKYRSFSHQQALTFLRNWRENFPQERIILIPVPDHLETLRALKQAFVDDPLVTLPDYTCSIQHSLAILACSDLCFTPDTSVVHFASAVDCPTLAIFQPNKTNFAEWHPIAPRSTTVFNAGPRLKGQQVYVANFSWEQLVSAHNKVL